MKVGDRVFRINERGKTIFATITHITKSGRNGYFRLDGRKTCSLSKVSDWTNWEERKP